MFSFKLTNKAREDEIIRVLHKRMDTAQHF